MRINLVVLLALVSPNVLLLGTPTQAQVVSPQPAIAQASPNPVVPATPATPTVDPSTTPTAQVPPKPTAPTEPATPVPATPAPVTPATEPVTPPAPANEPQVLVGEVVVKTAPDQPPLPPEIEKQVYDVISTRPGRTTTRTQLQSDINAVFATGFFSNVQAEPEDTDIGVRVTFFVMPNPVLKAVKTDGTKVLEPGVIDRIFGSQIGKVTNLKDLQAGVKTLEKYYQDNGYALAQIIDIKAQPDGTVTLVVAEGEVEDIKVAYLNEEGKTQDKDGKPVGGTTRDFIITRELSLKPGDVFNKSKVQSDLQRVFGLGLFDDVNLGLAPGTDPHKVIVTVNVKERNTGSIAIGAGLSSATGLFGTVSFQQQNLGGNNQKLGLDIQLGERELLFDLNFTDPWLAGDPNRTSFTANIFSRRVFSYVLDSPVGVGTNNDTAQINRIGFGFSFSRPLDVGTTASIGARFERVRITDSNGNTTPLDVQGNQLTIDPSGQDDLLLLQFAYAKDGRNDPIKPTSGSVFRIAAEQSIPFGNGSIFLSRLRASYSFYIPVQFLNFSEGAQALAFNFQAGTVLGTLPPYEAFQIGGSNSVRGWDEGKIGSGRSFGLVSAEYRFPVFSIVGGVLFADYGTDFGTGTAVIGNPAGVRGKPGNGGGYGVGVRIQSPLGAIRVDYGIGTNGSTQFSFGLGEKF
ncbi:BamA/TamA family outer membrane protein [Tumidithrix elongata RA019]|uniref:BamA/TamA family outer membrane protein n=1 Tax=Tumidithrix elongata BACA0141 TaxID=2716417 RepID=A0AAW9PRE0_9CYAN|nr:BamA/TamA family outer membrane protein [Tumidithrix elongata RA019]